MRRFSKTNELVAGLVLYTAIAGTSLSALTADEIRQPDKPQPAEEEERKSAAIFLQRYCFDCHAEDAQEANIRLDALDFSQATPRDAKMLESILKVVSSGQMPPEDAESPSANERQLLTSWLTRRLDEMAGETRRSSHRTRNRRLTVDEYNFTMQSLFGVNAEFADGLPPDPVSQDGFQNNSELLGLSALQMECYLDGARRAVERYVQFGGRSEKPVRYHVEFENLEYTTADRYGTRKKAPPPVDRDDFEARRAANLASPPLYAGPFSPIPPGPFPTEEELRAAIPKLHQQFLAFPECPTTGEMVVRIRAAATPDRNGRFPRMRVESGITLGDGDWMDKRLLGEVDVAAPLDDPKVYEFRIRVEDVPTKGPLSDEDAYDKLSVFDMVQLFISNVSRDERAIYGLGRGGYPASASDRVEIPLKQMADAGVNFLHLDCVEVEMLPGTTADGANDWLVDTALAEEGEDEQRAVASELLKKFMERAYRRPVSADEVAKKLELWEPLRDDGYSFEESLRETLVAVLVSPAFLFLEPSQLNHQDPLPAEGNAYALASRLSYFLWLAPPDEMLLQCAADGSLLQTEVLASETQRLLKDPRSRRFLDSFCRQWLRLDKHQIVAVDTELYRYYDTDLAQATVDETLRYFAEVFHSSSSALDLIDSDYAVLNDRLAEHYGIDHVIHGEWNKVALPEDSVRGGLLTQASLLTMNSDGVDSHPIKRGVWLLDRLLNSPPPPPPPNVPEINDEDPDFRGLSLKERIELHRNPGACQSCHRQIDPWGLAFENFDATGRWRESVHLGEESKERSSPVDADVQLPGGEQIDGIEPLKRYLREERREQFARALVHHMLTYALGRSLDFADRHHVEAIHQRFAASEYRLNQLVPAIVESDAFRQ